MQREYNNYLKLLAIITIICFIIYIACNKDNLNLISDILGNLSMGIITGLIILFITNYKNSLIYKNDLKIKKLRTMIDNSKNYEIKTYEFKNTKYVNVLELIYLYADLSNLFKEIEEYNKDIYIKNKCECEILRDACVERLGELSDVIHKVHIDYKQYERDLDSKMFEVFKLRRSLQTDLQLLEDETSKLYKSIL